MVSPPLPGKPTWWI